MAAGWVSCGLAAGVGRRALRCLGNCPTPVSCPAVLTSCPTGSAIDHHASAAAPPPGAALPACRPAAQTAAQETALRETATPELAPRETAGCPVARFVTLARSSAPGWGRSWSRRSTRRRGLGRARRRSPPRPGCRSPRSRASPGRRGAGHGRGGPAGPVGSGSPPQPPPGVLENPREGPRCAPGEPVAARNWRRAGVDNPPSTSPPATASCSPGGQAVWRGEPTGWLVTTGEAACGTDQVGGVATSLR
jgi:hypothetical protein